MDYIDVLKNIIDSGKIIDNAFIYDLWKEYIIYNDLFNECSSINFVNKISGNSLACYSSCERKVLFNMDFIKKNVVLNAKNYGLKDYEFYCYINLKILEVILHEFEHIMQEKRSYSYFNDLETQLISWCKTNMELWAISKNKSIYNKTYKFNPCERLAELRSYKNILEILKVFCYDVNKIVNLLDNELSFYQLRGYRYKRDIVCPTEIYFMNTGLESIWYNMDFYSLDRKEMLKLVQDNYNYEQRILLGLPISKEEFKRLVKKSLLK